MLGHILTLCGALQVRVCARHRQPEMIDLLHKRCEFPGCQTRPIYGPEVRAKITSLGDLHRFDAVMHDLCVSSFFGIRH